MKSLIFTLIMVIGNLAAASAPSTSLQLQGDSQAQIETYLNAFNIFMPELQIQADSSGGWSTVEELELVSKYWRGEKVQPTELIHLTCCGKAACGCFE